MQITRRSTSPTLERRSHPVKPRSDPEGYATSTYETSIALFP